MFEIAGPPNIVGFHNYQDFLRAFFNWKKATSPKFSHRKFALLAEIKSSNFLMLVMDRKRNLSEDKARSVGRAMKLKKLEVEHFILLVRMETAKTDSSKAKLGQELQKSVRQIVSRTLPADKAEYLSSWYIPLVRELIFLPDFVAKPDWVSSKFNGMVSATQAENAIRILLNLGFWKRTDQAKIEVSEILVDTGSEEQEYQDVSVSKIHKETLVAWSKILEQTPPSERELGLINIPINSAKIPELKKRIQNFQDEIIGWLQDEKEPEQLVQLGTYLIPVTRKTSH